MLQKIAWGVIIAGMLMLLFLNEREHRVKHREVATRIVAAVWVESDSSYIALFTQTGRVYVSHDPVSGRWERAGDVFGKR